MPRPGRIADAPPLQHHPLRIVHCFRSPVGGIFRHVRDLIDEQVDAGHKLGVICDNNTGGTFEETMLAELAPKLSLGLHRFPMSRAIRPSDAAVMARLYRTVSSLDLDVLHSHGAKGGAYSRLIGTALALRNKAPARLYCPHGGSMHFASTTLSGRIYFMLERALERVTDQLVFVSNYERDAYLNKVGKPNCPYSVVRNGLRPEEFAPVPLVRDAADFLYIGMMRDLKGVDVLLDALDLAAKASAAAHIGRNGRGWAGPGSVPKAQHGDAGPHRHPISCAHASPRSVCAGEGGDRPLPRGVHALHRAGNPCRREAAHCHLGRWDPGNLRPRLQSGSLRPATPPPCRKHCLQRSTLRRISPCNIACSTVFPMVSPPPRWPAM